MGSSNFYLEIARVVEANPDRIAVDSGDGATMTYGELDAGVARYANSLHDLGLQRGDRVAVQVNKCVPSLLVYLACLRAGLVYLPLNTAYRSAELDYFLRDAEPGLVLVEPEQQSEMQALSSASIGASVMTLKGDGATSLAQRAAGSGTQYSMQVPAAADELAVIIYTSGTTGRSKGAMVTHGNLVSNARALTRTWQFRKEDVLLHALPIFHVHGLFVANHCALTTGACLRWKDRFNAAELAREIRHCTVLMGVPTYYVRLLDQPGFSRDVCANMRLFVSGSAPLLAETHRDFEQRTGHRILERYGMSEAGMITSNPYDGERRAGTVGFPLPGVEVRVVDDANNPVPEGGKGAIQIKGPNVFKGYWRQPEKTQDEFTADGWFRTGDIGTLDAEGYLSIVGRAKDLIITGGYNVYPKEIEMVIDDLPAVSESAVIGVADADFGEAVTAVVVVANGARIDEAETIKTLKTKLAGYKVPKRIHVVEALPRNAMGKVQKNVLREQFGQ